MSASARRAGVSWDMVPVSDGRSGTGSGRRPASGAGRLGPSWCVSPHRASDPTLRGRSDRRTGGGRPWFSGERGRPSASSTRSQQCRPLQTRNGSPSDESIRPVSGGATLELRDGRADEFPAVPRGGPTRAALGAARPAWSPCSSVSMTTVRRSQSGHQPSCINALLSSSPDAVRVRHRQETPDHRHPWDPAACRHRGEDTAERAPSQGADRSGPAPPREPFELAVDLTGVPRTMSALSTSDTPRAVRTDGLVARLTTSMTSSHSPRPR